MRNGRRKRLSRGGSRRLFTSTAKRVHRKNGFGRPMRGGIRT
jgi:hypothetical protein